MDAETLMPGCRKMPTLVGATPVRAAMAQGPTTPIRLRAPAFMVHITNPATRERIAIEYVRALDAQAAADVVKAAYPGHWICAEGWNP